MYIRTYVGMYELKGKANKIRLDNARYTFKINQKKQRNNMESVSQQIQQVDK